MSGVVPHITGVSGGAVLAATYAELEQLASAYAHAGLRLLGWSRLPVRTLVDVDLLASAALAPISFGRVEAALTGTLTGRAGLPVVAADWEALAVAVIAARAAIEAADSGEVQQLWLDTKELLLLETPDDPTVDRGELAIAGAVGLLVTGVGADRLTQWNAILSGLYGAETGVTMTALPSPAPAAGTTLPPRDLVDLAAHLGALGELPDGAIEVQTLVDPDGTRHHVVYLPGTDDLNPLSSDDQLRDMQENVRLIGGRDTAYAGAVLTALHEAGVRPGEPVLLAGHSQGGMVAAAVAAHASPYDVTNVVTFGSPAAQAPSAPGVHLLSLEHDGDLVPQLAGVGHPSAEHVTVHFDSGVGGVVDNHSLAEYAAGATAVDSSTDPDVTSSLATLSAYFAPGKEVRSQLFQLTRDR